MLNGFREAVAEVGAAEVPFTEADIDQPIAAIRDAADRLMRRSQPPDGFVCATATGTLALIAGIEDAGFKVGRDVDAVSKQSASILHLFRREIFVVNEDIRKAGAELARIVLALIDGAEPASLQSLYVPGEVLAAPEPAALTVAGQ
jgi:LacI family transcriptional regulator